MDSHLSGSEDSRPDSWPEAWIKRFPRYFIDLQFYKIGSYLPNIYRRLYHSLKSSKGGGGINRGRNLKSQSQKTRLLCIRKPFYQSRRKGGSLAIKAKRQKICSYAIPVLMFMIISSYTVVKIVVV